VEKILTFLLAKYRTLKLTIYEDLTRRKRSEPLFSEAKDDLSLLTNSKIKRQTTPSKAVTHPKL